MNKSDRYIEDILSGKTYHGKYVLKSVQNIVNDRSNSKKWQFDQETADKYVRFIEKLVFTEGEKHGQRVELEDWQAFFISQLFGWVSKKDKTKRRFVETTLCVPRKNGKSTMTAVIAISAAYLDDSPRGQVYMAATSQKQARFCFDAAWHAVKETPGLSERIKVSAHNLLVKKNSTFIKYVSSEAGGMEGSNPSVAVLDEEHLQVDNELRSAIRLGMGTRKNPLFISISTAGSNKNGPYYKHIQNCKSFIDGITENDRHFALIYEPDSEDWHDENIWKQSNPNYGVSVDPELFLQDYLEAVNEPAKQASFKTKRLNIWADSETVWIDSKKWENLNHKLTLDNFKGCDAWMGLDLGETGDFTALTILIPKEDKIYIFMRFWIAKEMAGKRTRADRLNFTEWARQGFIRLTEGNATDYNVVENDIIELSKNLNVRSFGYDSAFASMLTSSLTSKDIPCHPVGQGVTTISGPTRQLNDWIIEEKILHDGNPVMAWMVGNVHIYLNDANNNFKIHKGMSKNKVDGPSSAVNAVSEYLIDLKKEAENKEIESEIW